jgi:hypothetical protein
MRLSFEDDHGKRHFEFCFVGFVLGGSMQDKKGMVVMRREVVLFEKLESISDLKPCGKKMANGEAERQLKKGEDDPKAIDVTLDEMDMLYNYLTAVPWQSGTPTRQALETIDWLQTCQREARNG